MESNSVEKSVAISPLCYRNNGSNATSTTSLWHAWGASLSHWVSKHLSSRRSLGNVPQMRNAHKNSKLPCSDAENVWHLMVITSLFQYINHRRVVLLSLWHKLTYSIKLPIFLMSVATLLGLHMHKHHWVSLILIHYGLDFVGTFS